MVLFKTWVCGRSRAQCSDTGFDAVRERAVRLAKKTADAAFALANELPRRRIYLQSQIKWYADQTHRIGQLMIKALGGMNTPQSTRRVPKRPNLGATNFLAESLMKNLEE